MLIKMFEIIVLDLKNNNRFIKVFNDSIKAYKFVRKVNFSKNLKLLSIINNSYMFD